MKLLNKVFSGTQTDKQPLAPPVAADTHAPKEELNLTPMDPLAAGESVADDFSFAAPLVSPESAQTLSLPPDLTYLEKYEKLQTKMDISELYEIFNTLESITTSVANMNASKGQPDDFLENWKPLLSNIEAFTVKKKMLQTIEAQMNQTITELRDIHQKMFDSIGQVRTYNSERETMYAARRQLADDLEKKLRVMQSPD